MTSFQLTSSICFKILRDLLIPRVLYLKINRRFYEEALLVFFFALTFAVKCSCTSRVQAYMYHVRVMAY
jgi:hypothetical protein